jgi:putative membrane protein
MSLVPRIALALGLAALIALVVGQGAGTLLGLLSHAGWILLLLVPLQVIPMLCDVLGWRALLAAPTRVGGLFLIAWIRQAINRLLPVASVGGEIVGVRLLRRQGVGGMSAAASVIVELMLGLVAQYVFVALGVVCLFARLSSTAAGAGGTRVLQALLFGLVVSLPPLILMIIVLRHGRVFLRIERVARRFLGGWLSHDLLTDQGARLDEEVRGIFAGSMRVGRSLLWQLGGYVVGVSEVWFAVRWLGHPVSVGDALVLESLTQAAKSVFFMVPASLGVQEAGLMGVGLLLGLGTDVALALSLAKRLREVVFGVPALLIWQWMEVSGASGVRPDPPLG